MKLKNLIMAIFAGCLVTTCLYLFLGIAILASEATFYPSLHSQIGLFIIFFISSVGIGLKFIGAFDE